jgi:hypothetical protein
MNLVVVVVVVVTMKPSPRIADECDGKWTKSRIHISEWSWMLTGLMAAYWMLDCGVARYHSGHVLLAVLDRVLSHAMHYLWHATPAVSSLCRLLTWTERAVLQCRPGCEWDPAVTEDLMTEWVSVLVVRTVYRWRWVLSISAVILTGENSSTW